MSRLHMLVFSNHLTWTFPVICPWEADHIRRTELKKYKHLPFKSGSMSFVFILEESTITFNLRSIRKHPETWGRCFPTVRPEKPVKCSDTLPHWTTISPPSSALSTSSTGSREHHPLTIIYHRKAVSPDAASRARSLSSGPQRISIDTPPPPPKKTHSGWCLHRAVKWFWKNFDNQLGCCPFV